MTSCFSSPLHPDDVGRLVEFNALGTAAGDTTAALQRRGTAGLYNMLCQHRAVWLADEVGMGKTFQALALVSLVLNEKPDARVLLIAPSQRLQSQWKQQYSVFLRNHYRAGRGDDVLTSAVDGSALYPPDVLPNLRAWVAALHHPDRSLPILRHSSFTRPFFVTKNNAAVLIRDWRLRLAEWGLPEVAAPKALSQSNASKKLNEEVFGPALEELLSRAGSGDRYFDLVVVDEAQCLRHPNQRNTVLQRVLRKNTARWLFISATPVHSDRQDLRSLLERYPEPSVDLAHDVLADEDRLRAFLGERMIRRPRVYLTEAGDQRTRSDYRAHVADAPWRVDHVSPLTTLTMGLVQKGLVQALAGRGHRFRVGFLSSFESLTTSITRGGTERTIDPDSGDEIDSDWNERPDDEPEAPDTGFIESLQDRFRRTFDQGDLPHPKLDAAADAIAAEAFGGEQRADCQKVLVFVRRISTVAALRERLEARFQRSVASRVEAAWGLSLADVEGRATSWGRDDGPDESVELFLDFDGEGWFQRALREGGWLNNYRRTFESGRNELFFEENWPRRLCLAAGVDPLVVAQSPLLEPLWKEAARRGRRHKRSHRGERLWQLALLLGEDTKWVHELGADADAVSRWAALLNATHPDPSAPDRAGRGSPNPAAFAFRSFWDRWADDRPEDLPGLPGDERLPTLEDFQRRQLLKGLIARTLLHTEHLIDLCCADPGPQAEGDRVGAFLDRACTWLFGESSSARAARSMMTHWIEHLDTILPVCFPDFSFPDLARRRALPDVHSFQPVRGVSGSTGRYDRLARQFCMPTPPHVLVCTDVLKEGVNLHLFCDRVVHYGLAWTAGDLEQRVGRVDRYNSLIQRRIGGADGLEARLEARYPHVKASLEKAQVNVVIDRIRDAEVLLDTPTKQTLEVHPDDVEGRRSAPRRPPMTFPDPAFCKRGWPAASPPSATGDPKKAVVRWLEAAADRLNRSGVRAKRTAGRLELQVAVGNGVSRLEVAGHLAPGRPVATLSPSPLPAPFRDHFRSLQDEDRSILRLLLPRESSDLSVLNYLLAWHRGDALRTADELAAAALGKLSLRNATRRDGPHHCAVVCLGDRRQNVAVRAWEGLVEVGSTIAPVRELPEHVRSDVRRWAFRRNAGSRLDALVVNSDDTLRLTTLLAHNDLSATEFGRLIHDVARRADDYEARLIGEDRL